MLKTRPFSFSRAHRAAELATGGQRALFYLWNVLVLLLSSLAISVFCLRLGIGLSDTQIFKDYFHFPLLLLLNTLPVLALQLLLILKPLMVFALPVFFFLKLRKGVAGGGVGVV